ncbi:cytochrome p450 85a1 [Quercus suber]|uniref:Cytochrome p450 85a1 n=1 Tax=Quercus suber TaxID=58331 RepID=A0AAW0J204_QUESU
MWSVWLSVISLLIVISTHWVYRWRNPKCNGKLPPGSMGIPLIGETLDFLVSNNSLDTPPFIKKRMMKFGPIFRTSLAGRPIVVSSDPEFNYYVFQQDGKLVEQWYMDSFDKLIGQDVITRVSNHRDIHKYIRNSILSHVGPEALKNKLLPHLEDAISQKLQGWSKLPSLEVKKSLADMIFKLTAKLLISYDAEKSGDNIDDFFSNFMEGLMKLPLNIPGTAYHKCLQSRQKLVNLITKIYEERKRNPEIGKGDILDQILAMKTETFLTDKFIIYVIFGILLASFETISSTLTLAIKLLSDKPKVVKELTWYMDSFDKLIGQDVITRVSNHRDIHKYIRNSILSHVGPEALKNKLLPHFEDAISQKLQGWSKLPSLEVKKSLADMIFKLTAKLLISYDAEKSGDNIDDFFSNFMEGLMKLPLNIPGTAYHKCLQSRQKLVNLITKIYEERKRNPEIGKGDILDQILAMKTETFLTDKFIIYVIFGILLASFETISSTLTLAIKLLSDKPKVVKELTEEHEAILKSREDANSGLTWKEYKSMIFTHNVVNESLRLASVAPGILRKTIQDIEVNGYTIPKGWCLLVVPSAIQLNPNIYEDPLSFDPWRWQGISANVTAKNFIPFGAGTRTCAGADFSKVFMAVFLHVLVTKYRCFQALSLN